MQIVSIVGSPKKRGNTATLMDMVDQGLVDQGHRVQRIFASDPRVECCKGCGACQRATELPGCVQTDEGSKQLRQLAAADVIIYGTPLYGWGFSAQIKPLIDRHFAMVVGYHSPAHRSALEGKRLALVVTCAGADEGNADLIRTQFDRMAGDYLKAGSVHKYVLPRCYPIDLGAARKLADQMIGELGKGSP